MQYKLSTHFLGKKSLCAHHMEPPPVQGSIYKQTSQISGAGWNEFPKLQWEWFLGCHWYFGDCLSRWLHLLQRTWSSISCLNFQGICLILITVKYMLFFFFFFLLISHHVFFPNSVLKAAVLVSHCWERLWWDRTDTCRSEGYLIAFSSRCSPKKQESTHRCRDRLQGSFLICSPGMWGCSIEALLFLLPPALADDLCQLHKSASLLSVHLLCTSTMFRICVVSSHVVKITFKVISGNIFFFFFFEWEGSWKMWGSS